MQYNKQKMKIKNKISKNDIGMCLKVNKKNSKSVRAGVRL